jgi:hypothetical protein
MNPELKAKIKRKNKMWLLNNQSIWLTLRSQVIEYNQWRLTRFKTRGAFNNEINVLLKYLNLTEIKARNIMRYSFSLS